MWPVSVAHQRAETISIFIPSLGAHGFPSNPEDTTIAPVMIGKEIKREKKSKDQRPRQFVTAFSGVCLPNEFPLLSSMVAEESRQGLAAKSMVGLILPHSVLLFRVWVLLFKLSAVLWE